MIKTPMALRRTGNFDFSIYQDEDYSIKLAVLEGDLYVPKGELKPGDITFTSITPGTTKVQEETSYTFIFRTENPLDDGASIDIVFPPEIILVSSIPGQVLFITVTATVYPEFGDPIVINDIIQVSEGSIITGNTFQIVNIFTTDPPEGQIEFTIVINGVQNPVTSKDIGGVIIITYIDGDKVDTGEFTDMFKPTAGQITPVDTGGSAAITVVPPLTSGTSSVFTLIFQTQSKIPDEGELHIVIPNDFIINSAEIFSSGTCSDETQKRSYICQRIDGNILVLQVQ